NQSSRWKSIFADWRTRSFGQRGAGGVRRSGCNNQRKANCARRLRATSSRTNSEIVIAWTAHAEADSCLALCGRNHRQLHFRSHRRKFARAFIEAALEILRDIRVERIRRQIRRHRAVTPMLVHPEPGRGIFPDNRLELVPASLRHFLERSAGGKFDSGMKNHAV